MINGKIMLYREGFPTNSFKLPLDANFFLPASLYSLITTETGNLVFSIIM